MTRRTKPGPIPTLVDPVRVSAQLDGPLVDRLDRLASIRGESRSEVIRTALRAGLRLMDSAEAAVREKFGG